MNAALLLAIGLGTAVVAIVWFLFMAPLENDMHERRMEMIRRKIEKREEKLKAQCGDDSRSDEV